MTEPWGFYWTGLLDKQHGGLEPSHCRVKQWKTRFTIMAKSLLQELTRLIFLMFLCGTMVLWIPSLTFFLFNNKTEEFLLKKPAHFLTNLIQCRNAIHHSDCTYSNNKKNFRSTLLLWESQKKNHIPFGAFQVTSSSEIGFCKTHAHKQNVIIPQNALKHLISCELWLIWPTFFWGVGKVEVFVSSVKHRHYEKTLKSSGKCFIYGKLLRHTNKVSLRFLLRDALHEPFFLETLRVISSIITRNFFVTRNKQPMTIGTNRMCISWDDNCVNIMCFPRQ